MNTKRGGAPGGRWGSLGLVRGGRVRSREELRALLRGGGFAVAQPTLSRDLRELGLARTPTGYAAPAAPAAFVPAERRADALDRALAAAVLAVEAAGALVVGRTPPARAHPGAPALDRARLPGRAGTVAGHDTAFV